MAASSPGSAPSPAAAPPLAALPQAPVLGLNGVAAGGAATGDGEGGEEAAIADNDLDEDDLENSMSLAAIEAELKPKVLETFDN
ncbi:MAG: RNA polymerase sigma factor RpoD, partial [Xanthobacteraceae bacterium]